MHQRGLVFLWFPIHPVVHRHTLSPFLSPSLFPLLFPISVSVGSQVSLLCPPVRAGMESGCVSPRLVHYVWAWQIRRSAAERSEMLSYLHLPRYSSGLIISQARTLFQNKSLIQQRLWCQNTYSSDVHPASMASKTRWLFENNTQIGFWKLAFQIHHGTISECKNIIKTRSLS